MRYYRPYTQDPHSLAALDRKSKKELSETKKGYENAIKSTNEFFDQKEYDSNKKKSQKKDDVLQAYELLKSEINKLKKEIRQKSRYFVWKNFFGGISSSTEIQYFLCEESDLTKDILKRLKELKTLMNKYNSKSYNESIISFFKSALAVDRIPHRNRPYDIYEKGIVKKYDLTSGKLINDLIETEAVAPFGSEPVRGAFNFGLSDKVAHPKQLYKTENWNTAIEVDKEYFSKGKESMRLQVGFLVGDFFKKYKSLHIFDDFEEIIDEEVFRGWRIDLLTHYERYSRKSTLNLRSIERNKKLAENLNFVYVMSNKSYKNLYKIGWTSLTPEERADQLSSETGVLYPFKVIFKKRFKDAEKVEKKIHRKFSNYRVKKNKEYFEAKLEDIKEYINSLDQ
jgi:hypothetical protein